MIVLKFGGTSVGNAANIKKVAAIVSKTPGSKIVVLSAVAGTTNALIAINSVLYAGAPAKAKQLVNELELGYHQLIDELYQQEYYQLKALTFIRKTFDLLRNLIFEKPLKEKLIIAQGEIISTTLFKIYLEEQQQDIKLLSALDFMLIDDNNEPQIQKIQQNLLSLIPAIKGAQTYITQGFICLNSKGQIDNLKRGGSDYSASLIGAAIGAKEIQIWTDINGLHNNDPRYVDGTYSIEELSFDEAAELAYFGAKILHPQSIIPAQLNNIPVLLKDTFNPEKKGTLIKNCKPGIGVRAIAAKDGIIAIKIKSYRMLLAYGFLKRIFEVFDNFQTAIDMITTSEIAVSLTIDDSSQLEQILQELRLIGKVECDTQMSIICLTGDFSQNGKGLSARVLNCLKDIPLRMISYGGSNFNMSLLVATSDKANALNLLNQGLFSKNQQKVLVN